MNTAWVSWIHEPIELEEAGCRVQRRKDVVYTLCEKGIFPLLTGAGYRLPFGTQELTARLLRALFVLSKGKQILPRARPEEEPNQHEQFLEYTSRLDTQTWLDFWEHWGRSQDFQEQRRTSHLKFLIPDLLWSWIDLQRSKSAVALEELIEEWEAQEEAAKGKDDPYLAETARRDYLDKHWH